MAVAHLHADIKERFGVLPSFFETVTYPRRLQRLWDDAQARYLDAPLPSLLKEQVFVLLSRNCANRYCLLRHLGFLVGLGRVAGDQSERPLDNDAAAALLNRAPATLEGLRLALERAQDVGPEATLEVMLDLCELLYLDGSVPPSTSDAVRKLLGAETVASLLDLVDFIRSAHFRTLNAPEVQPEADVLDFVARNRSLQRAVDAAAARLGSQISEERDRRFAAWILESSQLLVQSLAPDGTLLYTNAAWKAFMAFEEFPDPPTSIFDVLHPDEVPLVQAAMRELAATPGRKLLDTRVVTGDGQVRAVRGEASFVFQNGRAVYSRGVYLPRERVEDHRLQNEQLRSALDLVTLEMKTVAVCAWCRSVRGNHETWLPFDRFLAEQLGSRVSHSICSSCAERTRSELPR